MAWWDKIGAGRTLTRATLVLAAATTAIFSIAGGRILLQNILGVVTTLVGGAANVYLQANPTVATATTTALCAALNINARPVGDILGITGVPTDPMLPVATGSAVPSMTMPVVISTGDIEFVCDAAPGGAVQWTITYQPIDDGAYAVAA
jgi:hypothetical protein